MDSSAHLIILLIVAVVVLGLWLSSFYFAEKRQEELYRWAISRGLSFDSAKNSSIKDRYPGFEYLRRGDNCYAYNIMQGVDQEQNRPIRAFDYHYETSSGRHTNHYYFSAVIVETGLPLKPLLIRNETLFDKIGDFMGFEAIHFESAEFNRQFHVTSPDRHWAFDVLPQPTMELLLKVPIFVLEIQDGCVSAYHDSKFSTNEFYAALALVFGFLDRIPKSVMNELKGAI